MKIRISKNKWEEIGKRYGWLKEGQTQYGEDYEYRATYEVEVPKDHLASSKVVKQYPVSEFAEIEKYDDGYFSVVNLIHGVEVYWTKIWADAKLHAMGVGASLK